MTSAREAAYMLIGCTLGGLLSIALGWLIRPGFFVGGFMSIALSAAGLILGFILAVRVGDDR